MSKQKTRHYTDFQEDFFQTDKEYKLDKNYEWINKSLASEILSSVIYVLALIFSNIYCRLFLGVKIKGATALKKEKGGFFLYGNHTHPIGDVFNPALICFPKRIYTVVTPANMYLPVIGKLLPFLGALPIPDTLNGMRKFNDAITQRIKNGHPIIIYPEAHLWDYYTDIRPFESTSFKYPANLSVPVYCMTTTYRKRKLSNKPKITIFVDGPFKTEAESKKTRAAKLQNMVYEKMKERSKFSNYNYITYISKNRNDSILKN